MKQVTSKLNICATILDLQGFHSTKPDFSGLKACYRQVKSAMNSSISSIPSISPFAEEELEEKELRKDF